MSTPYLKNASARKDADGDYWFFIQGGGLKAMFRLDPGEKKIQLGVVLWMPVLQSKITETGR